jgi:hypothetical protein
MYTYMLTSAATQTRNTHTYTYTHTHTHTHAHAPIRSDCHITAHAHIHALPFASGASQPKQAGWTEEDAEIFKALWGEGPGTESCVVKGLSLLVANKSDLMPLQVGTVFDTCTPHTHTHTKVTSCLSRWVQYVTPAHCTHTRMRAHTHTHTHTHVHVRICLTHTCMYACASHTRAYTHMPHTRMHAHTLTHMPA